MSKNPVDLDSPFGWRELARAFVWFLYVQKTKYFICMGLLFIVNLTGLLPTILTGHLIDRLTDSHTVTPGLYFIALSLGLILTLSTVVRLQLRRIIGTIRNKVIYYVQVNGFQRLLEQSAYKDTRETTGSESQKLTTGITQLKRVWNIFDSTLVVLGSSLIGSLATFVYIAPWYFSLMLIIYIVIGYGLTDYFIRIRYALINQFYASQENTSSAFIEGVANAVTIKAQGATQAFQKKVSENALIWRDLDNKLLVLKTRKWSIFQSFNGLMIGGFLCLALFAYTQKNITIGTISITMGLMLRLVGLMIDFMDTYDELFEAKQGVARMMPLFWDHKINWSGTGSFPNTWDTIQLIHVSHRYNKGAYILKDVDLTITRGTSIGIKGATGRGKSTLIKLLIGLLKPTSGKIMIGSQKLAGIAHDEIYAHIAVVQQETELFAMSVRDNVTLLRDTTESDLQRAITAAQFDSVVAKLPEGMETSIGEKGFRLSGGERQRLALARALVKNPDILIMDEATSALDLKTEKSLTDALHTLYPHLTMIIVAHRPHALAHCDCIYELVEGKLQLTATHDAQS